MKAPYQTPACYIVSLNSDILTTSGDLDHLDDKNIVYFDKLKNIG